MQTYTGHWILEQSFATGYDRNDMESLSLNWTVTAPFCSWESASEYWKHHNLNGDVYRIRYQES